MVGRSPEYSTESGVQTFLPNNGAKIEGMPYFFSWSGIMGVGKQLFFLVDRSWRSHLDVDFNALCDVAKKAILEVRGVRR